jgi:ubiquinone/menaquinone biosynthesis C-methylase UbiE
VLGDVSGKTVVIVGCGNGLSAIVLASRGARVIAVDISANNLKMASGGIRAQGLTDKVALLQSDATGIAARDASVDCVLCAETMDVRSSVSIGRQIRRILKPGGAAVLMQPIARFEWLAFRQGLLTLAETQSVSRAVGRGGRHREFRLTSQALKGLGMRSQSIAFGRAIASLLVWEAHKER